MASSVLVGAPQAQSEWQRSVHRGGAVYRCHVASSQCAQVPFDQSDGMSKRSRLMNFLMIILIAAIQPAVMISRVEFLPPEEP
ncbi:Protein of unknown function [Gryllus bimaculatus]|nr:Protein of unknown function [Gryllus bimaculatus]